MASTDVQDFAQDNNGDTELHRGFRNGITFEDVFTILSNGFPLELRNYKGRTILHEAAGYSNLGIRVFKLLLDFDANINSIDCEFSTVLHSVLQNPSVNRDMVEFFLKEGMNPDFRDRHGCPPLAYVESSHLSLPDQNIILRKLIQRTVLFKFKDYPFNQRNVEYCLEYKTFKFICLEFCNNQERCLKYRRIINSCISEVLKMAHYKITETQLVYDYVLAYCCKTPINLNEAEVNMFFQIDTADRFPLYNDLIQAMLNDSPTYVEMIKNYLVEAPFINAPV